MSSTTTKYPFNFPENWDRDNPLALRQFEKCAKSFDNINDFLNIYTRSFFYHLMIWCLILYSIISFFLIIINKNNYEVLKLNKTLMLIYTASGIICIINCYLRNVFYQTIPCSMVIYLIDIGYIPNFLSCMGCIMYYLQQCYNTINSYNKAINQNFIIRNEFFYRLCLNFNEEKFVKFLLYCTLSGVLFSALCGVFFDHFRYVPLTKGFCTTSGIEGVPLYLTLLVYFIFAIYALIELHKLGSDFVLRKSLMITLYVAIVLLFFNLLGNMTPFVKCAKIIRYIPHDSLLQIFSCIFNYAHITYPLIQLFYTKYEVKKLELTKGGLIHLLNDKTLFNEFLNFCNKQRCVEGVIFHREYKKFKNIFKDKDNGKKLAAAGGVYGTSSSHSHSSNYAVNIDYLYQNISESSENLLPYFNTNNMSNSYGYNNNTMDLNMGIDDDDDDENMFGYNYSQKSKHKRLLNNMGKKINEYVNIYSTNNVNNYEDDAQLSVDKKLVHIYDEIFQKANLIFSFFFTPNSDYELNVPDPIVKKIDRRLQSFNDNYTKMKSNQLFLFEELECEDIFDEAYDEVVQSLYLNTYSAFVKRKRKNRH
ncbi:hypothetical protein BCR32DRAFT_290395 [Anaeromyces robustus]|uniref:RGS domain-containing protein n=1 Tax=Anaeromyces robustus TaxID=1754192 RepID=A0A1Y1XKQ9_9FUNG|nr:hypothetical protein BCR32DRAFT_290395 [Anaeromyces robustus]|eukprot:ORX85934.1 hypothetical protein BCR32DRAFT_290395 [Anaeromyces robustus]